MHFHSLCKQLNKIQKPNVYFRHLQNLCNLMHVISHYLFYTWIHINECMYEWWLKMLITSRGRERGGKSHLCPLVLLSVPAWLTPLCYKLFANFWFEKLNAGLIIRMVEEKEKRKTFLCQLLCIFKGDFSDKGDTLIWHPNFEKVKICEITHVYHLCLWTSLQTDQKS